MSAIAVRVSRPNYQWPELVGQQSILPPVERAEHIHYTRRVVVPAAQHRWAAQLEVEGWDRQETPEGSVCTQEVDAWILVVDSPLMLLQLAPFELKNERHIDPEYPYHLVLPAAKAV